MSLRREVARQAYVWGLPTVRLYGVLHELVLAPERRGRSNRLNRLLRGTLPAAVAERVGPPASGAATFCAWLDLRRGPLRVEPVLGAEVAAPTVTTLLDLYADVVGIVPEEPGAPPVSPYVLVGPSWEPPAWGDAAAVLRCPTDLCLAVGRSPREVLRVHPWTVEASEPSPLSSSVPPVDVSRAPTMAFLRVLDWMLALMPTRPGEEEFRADLQMIGVASGQGTLDEAVAEDQLDGEVTRGLGLGFEDVRRSGRTSWPPPYPHVR